MNEEQLTSNGPEANLFKLEGKGVWITYGILRGRREFLDYRELYPFLAWPALALILAEIALAETVLRKLP